MSIQSLQTIESQDLTVGKLFDDFYVVPIYQREYVWEENEVEQLLEDINTEFTNERRDAISEYFIGSIVVFGRVDGVFELIDGQQRMTTIFLVFCALRDHALDIGITDQIAGLNGRIASSDVDDEGRNVDRTRVSLQYQDSRDVLDTIAKTTSDIDQIAESTRSVRNILNAYRVIRAFLKVQFDGDKDELRRFYAYFIKYVKLIRVKTISVTHALKVFETINDRGVGLDSMDLLKNLMFIHAKRDDFDRLLVSWKALVDELYQAKEKPLRFLRYFILARYNVDRLKEDEIYVFVRNERLCGYEREPLKFVGDLLSAAKAYAFYLRGLDATGQPNRYLTNIRLMSGAARQHFILLLAGQSLPPQTLNELCRHLENLFFAYVITREPTRDFEREFAQWAVDLRSVTTRGDLDAFIELYFQPAKTNLAARFALSFRELEEDSLQQYRLRYVLGKITQYVDEQARGSQGGESALSNFVNSGVDVEHILPQTPSVEVLASFDRPNDIASFVRRLGNLCLVEKSINTSIGNGVFEKKMKAYKGSKFLLTQSLVEKVSIGVNTAIDRAVRDLEAFDHWDSASIERRQAMLSVLAHRVWDMPVGIDSSSANL